LTALMDIRRALSTTVVMIVFRAAFSSRSVSRATTRGRRALFRPAMSFAQSLQQRPAYTRPVSLDSSAFYKPNTLQMWQVRSSSQTVETPKEKHALVQGSSRGIGLEMTRQLLEKGFRVMATCRNPPKAVGLQALMKEYPSQLVVSKLDVKDSESIIETAKKVEDDFGGILDVLINSAGILQDEINKPERQLSAINRDWMLHVNEVNAVGPLLVVQALEKFLKRPKNNNRGRAVIANLSARVGSIGDNRMGGWYSYRMSKAALNQATRCMSLELKRHGVCAISLHPGTVDTDFTKEYQKNVKPEKLFPVDRAARQLLEIIEEVELKDTGLFYGWDKEVIPF